MSFHTGKHGSSLSNSSSRRTRGDDAASPGRPGILGRRTRPEEPPLSTEPPPHAGPPAVVYPVGLRLQDRRVVVVGGGQVAHRRVAGLLEAGARR